MISGPCLCHGYRPGSAWLAGRPATCTGDLAGIGAALVFTVLAGLHALWAAGLPWPFADRRALALAVLGETGKRAPGRRATLGLAILLACAGVWVLALRGLVFVPPPAGVLRAALTWGMVGLFAVRGLGGFFEAAVRPAILGTPYLRWSLRLYSPLSLALAVAVGLAAI